jgi:hypothetical protein
MAALKELTDSGLSRLPPSRSSVKKPYFRKLMNAPLYTLVISPASKIPLPLASKSLISVALKKLEGPVLPESNAAIAVELEIQLRVHGDMGVSGQGRQDETDKHNTDERSLHQDP